MSLNTSKNRFARVSVASAIAAILGVAGAASAADEQAAGAAAGTLEEIVVTARKREELLIEVPLSISVVTPDQVEIQGIKNIVDLLGRVPSLFSAQNRSFSSNRDFMSIIVRGVGANPALEPSTGIFIDGIYQPGLGFDQSFLDVERVELLRGPQGALFGRNTEGGAVNIVTRKPGTEFRANANLQATDMKSVLANASLSGPVEDGKLYAGISAQGFGSDGWVRNTYLNTDQNSESMSAARFALRFTPSEKAEIDFTFDDTTRRGQSMGPGIPESAGESYDVAFDYPTDFDTHYYGAGLTINYEFDRMLLSSITGYRAVETFYSLDFDGGPEMQGNYQSMAGQQDVLSQELRVTSRGDGPFQWIGGLYYYDQSDDNELLSTWATYFGPPTADAVSRTGFDRTGYSAFGSVSYAAFDGFLDLTAGLRYGNEDADATRYTRLTIPAFSLDLTADTPRSESWSETSPNFQATINWSPEFKTYVNVAQGYKSGGWERIPTASSPFLTLDPETATNYEIGFKGLLLDQRLSYAVAAFRIDIEDMHTPTLVIDPDTDLPAAAISSAGKAHTQGFELEGTFSITDNLLLNASASWTEGQFDEFTDTSGNDRKGDDIPNIPKVLYNLNLAYDKPITAKMSFVASANVRHVDDYFSGLGTFGDRLQEYDSYDVIDLDVGIDYGTFRTGLFVRNAADDFIVTSKGYSPDQGEVMRQVYPPRTVGVRFSFSFE